MASQRESISYPLPRIGDISDWRLIFYIRSYGVSAYLRNMENPTQPVEPVLHRFWDRKEEGILQRIEDTVYDHPQILDDFSTDIIIETPRTLWVPDAVLDEETHEEKIETVYNSVYAVEPEDILSDCLGDKWCVYSLTAGLPAFLGRTFPGSRIMSHLTPEVLKFSERTADAPRIFIDIRDGEVDFIGLDGRNLLIAVTHRWNAAEDIVYHLLNICSVLELDNDAIQISLSAEKQQSETKQGLMSLLRKYFKFVMLTMVPHITTDSDMPLAATICASRMPSKKS